MNQIMPVFLINYCQEIIAHIALKYGISQMTALRKFMFSKTYAMLSNAQFAMWEFSPNGIMDMWEVEQLTGEPRNSLYLRRDDLDR